MEKVVIYARVSTTDQTTENQILKLRTIVEKNDWELTEIYVDEGISGAKGRDKRPEFNRLCKDMVRRKFDRILVWDVSRLGRSLQHLVEFLNEALTTRTDLYIHQSGLDTSTPSGRMMFQIIGVFSEFERTIISERVRAGLHRAQSKGKVLGRPLLPESVREAIRGRRAEGKSLSQIGAQYNLSKTSVMRICA
jgi:DNA invertase Pin-like site-specific DNA recombinase